MSPPQSTSSVLSLPQVGEAISRQKWQGHYRHTRLACRHLMRVAYGLERRLIFNLPPRHGKTLICGRLFPFFYMIQHPSHDVIYVSATGTLAGEQGEYVRGLIDDFGPSFGFRVSPDSHAKDNFDLVDLDGKLTGGSMRCIGATSGVHGRGAHLLLLDDLFGSMEDVVSVAYRDALWRQYTSSLLTRLTPTGAVVGLGTPFHCDDWFGRVSKAEEEGGDAFTRVRLPAFSEGPEDDPLGRPEGEPLWPEGGWTREVLDAKRANMEAAGQSRDWSSQYELKPVSGDGVTEWPDEYFGPHIWVDELPISPSNPLVSRVLALDPAKGGKAGDYSAFADLTLLKDGNAYIDTHLMRVPLPELYEYAVRLAKNAAAEGRPYRAFKVETNGFQEAVALAIEERLRKASLSLPVVHHVTSSQAEKTARIKLTLSGFLKRGTLRFLGRTRSNKLTVGQMREIPNGRHDDGPDAVEMVVTLAQLCTSPKAPPTTILRTR